MECHHLTHIQLREFYFITWNIIAGCQSSCSGCGGHFRGKDIPSKDWYTLYLEEIH